MTYEVIVWAEAKKRIRDQINYIAVEKCEPQEAAAWATRVDQAIASLDHMPDRCAIAPENDYTSVTIHMRQVNSHLILFSVDEQTKTVDVLSFRSGRQLPEKYLGERND